MNKEHSAAFFGSVILAVAAALLFPAFSQVIIFIMSMGIVWADYKAGKKEAV